MAVHAALLLSVRFIDPEGFNRVFQDTPLEVILVNAKSTERPNKAQAIAQSNLAAAAMPRRAGPPALPYSALTAVGDDLKNAAQDGRHAGAANPAAHATAQAAGLPCPSPTRARSDSGEQMSRRKSAASS